MSYNNFATPQNSTTKSCNDFTTPRKYQHFGSGSYYIGKISSRSRVGLQQANGPGGWCGPFASCNPKPGV